MAASPATPTPGLQLSFGAEGLLAWQPGRSVAGANLGEAVGRSLRTSRHQPRMLVRDLHTPTGSLRVMCDLIDADAFVSLHDDLGEASASVQWFIALRARVRQAVLDGQVVPRLHQRNGRWFALWQLPLPQLSAAADHLAPTMPAVCAAATPDADPVALTYAVVQHFTDPIARHALRAAMWPPHTTGRGQHDRVLRAVGQALVADPRQPLALDSSLADHLASLAIQLDHVAARADGRSVLAARVRLGLPDLSDDWPVAVEIVDVDDRSRWCAVDDLDTNAAEWLTASLPEARACAQATLVALTHEVPDIAVLLQHGAAAVPVEFAASLLERADELMARGVELLAPLELARRKPAVRATVSPRGESDGRMGAAALVEWDLTIDDTPVDEATLTRAAQAATSLVEVGGRWIRLAGADAQRALEAVAQRRSASPELDPIALMRLAAEVTAAGAGASTDDPEVAVQLHTTGWLIDLVNGLPDEALSDGLVSDAFTATLRPYQRRGLGWLQFLHRLGLGGCLADDMGLGKTPTTLAHLVDLPGPHLVICPLSVVRNWQNESARFTPLLRVMVLHGPARPKGDALRAQVASADIVVSTYQVLARDIDELAQIVWGTVVLDEAQAVKNHTTHAAKAARRLTARQRLALTGTPVENRLGELWAILDVVTPGLLGTEARFRREFAIPIEKHQDPAATEALRRITAPFLLRRTKADRTLVPDLPDKVEQVAWAGLTREQAAMYQAVVDQLLDDAQQAAGMRRRGLVLAALTRLKQICNHPAHALGDGSRLAGRSGKLIRFDELVVDFLDAGEQALVFTQFREMGELLVRHLAERFHITVPFLHGGVSRSGRDRMVDVFQSGSGSPLLLVSLQAGGTGLNLTAASRVVHYDRWWNPAVEDQATDRAWRIGQKQAVFVHKLVCQGTVEERVAELIDRKRALADAVVGTSGEQWLSELSTDDLRDLVTLDVHAARQQ